jgi:non-heme Fe2+,alpha-ketoglutarate-dependent halogenase
VSWNIFDRKKSSRTCPAFALSSNDLQAFDDNGYVGPFKVYEADEMTAMWRYERLELVDRSKAVYQIAEAESGSTNISNYDRHLDSTFLADHVCRPEIVDRASSILGPDVLCWRTEFFPKYPGDEGTDWHQADTFANASGTPQIIWPESAKRYGGTLTVWTAFTRADEDTACLQFIPGTHRVMHYDETKRMQYDASHINQREKKGIRRGFFGYDYRDLRIDPNWAPDESKAVSMVMRPGEAVLFSSTLMHASHPHRGKTNEMRLGFVARYVPACVRIYPNTTVVEEYGGRIRLDHYGAVLVCGKNKYKYNRIATATTRGHIFGTC